MALTRGDVVLMEVKVRQCADALQKGMYGWRYGIDGVKIQRRANVLQVDAYEWRHGIDGGKSEEVNIRVAMIEAV